MRDVIMSRFRGVEAHIAADPRSMSHHLSTSGGIQERIVAPIPRRPRAKLGDVRPTSKPTTPVAILHPPPRGLDHVLSGGLTAAGTIQERMRWPTRTGTEVMRTVAARVNLTPSHYAMLGVPRDFTEAQLRKQYRLLAMRYHPDAADRNGIDPQEALERFTALQTAYSVLSDPERRRRYDMQERLQHRREWRRAWDGPTLLLMDKSGGGGGGYSGDVGDADAGDGGSAQDRAEDGEGGGVVGEDDAEAVAAALAEDRQEKARRWEAQRVEWLRQQLEMQQQQQQQPLPTSAASAASAEAVDEMRKREQRLHEAREEEAEARRQQADAELALRQERERQRRQREKDRIRRQQQEQQRVALHEQRQQEEEEQAREVETRVRRQVEER
jgi:curved DNA-binding protein CbpA